VSSYLTQKNIVSFIFYTGSNTWILLRCITLIYLVAGTGSALLISMNKIGAISVLKILTLSLASSAYATGENDAYFAQSRAHRFNSSCDKARPVFISTVDHVDSLVQSLSSTQSNSVQAFVDEDLLEEFEKLDSDGKEFVNRVMLDPDFKKTLNFKDLPFSIRNKWVDRYGMNHWSNTGPNYDFPEKFNKNKYRAILEREIDFHHEQGKKYQAEALSFEQVKQIRNSKPSFKTFSDSDSSRTVFHGGGFIYLTHFLLGDTEGVQFHGVNGDTHPRFGLWVSPVENEEKARVQSYGKKALKASLDYPAVLQFNVTEKYLDAVPNTYEAGLSASNLDKISDIILTVPDLAEKIYARDISELRTKLNSLVQSKKN
jgi:hypothetical protein